MKLTTTVEADGDNLDGVLECAREKLAAYFGHQAFTIESVNAEPLLESVGSVAPEIWRADVTASGERP